MKKNETTSAMKISPLAIVLICITIIAASGNILLMHVTLHQSRKIDQLEQDRAYCETEITNFMNASDYLTNEVWLYAVDEDPVHMKNFWNEVTVKRSRDKALQRLLHENLSEQERVHAMRAKSYSDNLLESEIWCMRLIAESNDVPPEQMSERVRMFQLNDEEKKLSATEKKERGRIYLFGNAYSTTKQNIRTMVQSFQSDLSVRMNEEVKIALETNSLARTYGVLFSTVLMMLMIMGTILYSVMTRRKSRQLSEALEKAEAASSAKTYFTARMSHEIRTPLNAVLGYMTIAKTENDVNKRNVCLNKCEIAANNLLNIVNDVLDLSAIESRRMKLADSAYSISKMLDTIDVVYSKQAEKKNITFTLSTTGIIHDMVNGDVQRTTQIITNLVSNAIKFTPENGTVEIIATQEKNKDNSADKDNEITTQYLVKDNGIGMSPEFLTRIFEPYEQADSSISQKYGGTGLGLSIVKSMAEMMNGSVSVSSELGKGSTFIVTLPTKVCETVEQNNASTAATTTTAKNLNGIKVLLAEDNEMNSEIATVFLENLGASVTVVKDGLFCAEKFGQSAPGTYDVILMDVLMPRMNGYDATKRIRSSSHPQAKDIPIIAMTANAFSSDVQQALDAGMNAHVAKPFDIDVLVETVSKFCN